VVLAEGEDIQADPVGELDLLEGSLTRAAALILARLAGSKLVSTKLSTPSSKAWRSVLLASGMRSNAPTFAALSKRARWPVHFRGLCRSR
jgi:hypothetical protein